MIAFKGPSLQIKRYMPEKTYKTRKKDMGANQTAQMTVYCVQWKG